MQQGPTNTDDEGEGVDDMRINALVDEFLKNNSYFSQINRYILYQMILIGDKLIANMHCVLTRKEWCIVHKCYNMIMYYIYTKSSQDKSRNVRNFLIVLTSKKITIEGVEDVEGRLLHSAIMINQMDIFCIILSYISKTHDLDFYTKILSILVTNDTRLHLLEEFWTFMDLGNKYKDVIKISSPSLPENIKANVLKIKKFMNLQSIAAPNIKRFLSYQNTLLRNNWIEKKEEYNKKRSISPQSSNKRIKLE
jgi:hypothetical protein